MTPQTANPEEAPAIDGFSLFRGLSIVIDDHVNDQDVIIETPGEGQSRYPDEIVKVLKAIRDQKLPILKYKELPEDDIIKHLGAINFILLDWELHDVDTPIVPGVSLGATTVAEDAKAALCKFLREVIAHTYCPIFIFSNVDIDSIRNSLEEHGLAAAIDTRILIAKKKSVNTHEKLKNKINLWTKENPSFLCLKAWENSFNSAKADTFIELAAIDKNWPRLFWKTFNDDNIYPWPALAEVISRNVIGRADLAANPLELNSLINTQPAIAIPRDTVASIVARAECTLLNSGIHPPLSPGDIFTDLSTGQYWVNVRPVCDIAHLKQKAKADPELYLLPIQILTDDEIAEWNDNGVINHPHSANHLIPFLPLAHGAYYVCVNFDALRVARLSTLTSITRLLAPRATELSQRYGFYITQCDADPAAIHLGAFVKYEEKLYLNIRPFFDGDSPDKELHLLAVESIDVSPFLKDGVVVQKLDSCHLLPQVNIEGETIGRKILFKLLRTVSAGEAQILHGMEKADFHKLLLRYGFYISRAGVMRIPQHA